MPEPIRLDELLAELDRLGVPNDPAGEGHTLGELSEQWSCGRAKALQYLRKCVNAGIVKANKGKRPAIDGVLRPVPCYIFVVPEKKRKK